MSVVDPVTGLVVYQCSHCSAKDCKLWREYNTFLSAQSLYCLDCASRSQNRDTSSMDETGRYEGPYGKTDQINGLIPAVPTEESDTFWGYTSVPEHLCQWWRALPNRPVQKG